jgi:FkbM family methyltransferase
MHSVREYARMFRTPVDAYRYFDLRVREASSSPDESPAVLRIRPLGGAALACRPARDVWTFKSTFVDGFHRPPLELPPNAVILDLGCNVGYTVADLAARHPTARVIGVEMDAVNHALAVQNTAPFSARVTLIHGAVWVEDGEIAYSGMHADGFRIDLGAPGSGDLRAPAMRIETILTALDVHHVDYVKIDVEGAESALFQDADWLARVATLKVEIHPPATVPGLVEVLTSRGMTCWLDPRHPRAICAATNGDPRLDSVIARAPRTGWNAFWFGRSRRGRLSGAPADPSTGA